MSRWIRAKASIRAIACSTKTLQHNSIHGIFADACVIPNGISMPDGCLPARGRPSREFNLIYFGQIECHKGILQLVRAFKEIRADFAGTAKLHFAGNGSDESAAALNDLIDDLGLRGHVVQHGFCDQPKLRKLLQDMQLAVFPLGDQEPFAYVVIEAIQAGLPVVVSRAAGCAEFLPGNYPYFIEDRNDCMELSSLLRSAMKDGDLASKWCSILQQVVQEQCDLDRACLPKCVEFLGKSPAKVPGNAEVIPIGEGRRYERSISDALSSWYSLAHLNTLLPEAVVDTHPKKSIGRSIERWIRHRIPKGLRKSWRAKRSHASKREAA